MNMSEKYPRFPEITYHYWSQKNEYFSDFPLIGTIKVGLNHARKGGLIDEVIKKSSINTNKNLVDLIQLRIQKFNFSDGVDNKDLMIIFDLIQGWGGKACRNIYVQPKSNPTRHSLVTLPLIYTRAINYCISGDYKMALEEMLSIPNLGESFATKHIFFWSEFGPSRKGLPIYDTRIKTLLFMKASAAGTYDAYINALNEKARELSVPSVLVERALFSFSQNYFPNSSLTIKKKLLDSTDMEEARNLQTLSAQLKTV